MKSFDVMWEEIHAKEEWGKYPAEPVIRFMARNYYKQDRKAIKILDFCCGAGSNTWYLAKEGFDVYAFDGSQSAVNKVREKIDREGLHANLKVCDALEAGYKNEFFDCIIDHLSIVANRFGNIEEMYKEIYRMLKNGGGIFTATLSRNTTGYGTGEEIEENTYTNITCGNLAGRGIIHFFDEEEITKLLYKVGFRDIHVDLLHYTDKGNIVEEYLVNAYKIV